MMNLFVYGMNWKYTCVMNLCLCGRMYLKPIKDEENNYPTAF